MYIYPIPSNFWYACSNNFRKSVQNGGVLFFLLKTMSSVVSGQYHPYDTYCELNEKTEKCGADDCLQLFEKSQYYCGAP